MQEKHLLLPSARSAVLVRPPYGHAHYVRAGAVAVGIVCVLAGAADITSRLLQSLGPDAAFLAFAPPAAIGNPALFGATSTPGVITPARLRIPSLGVNAEVESTGLRADGAMGAPQNLNDVAWYSGGAKPGEKGSAVFAGHVSNALLKPGVFERLSSIKIGDYITVEDGGGKALVYRVSEITEYPANAPAGAIFDPNSPPRLVLITCDGDWVPSARTYDKRLVVVATPAY